MSVSGLEESGPHSLDQPQLYQGELLTDDRRIHFAAISRVQRLSIWRDLIFN